MHGWGTNRGPCTPCATRSWDTNRVVNSSSLNLLSASERKTCCAHLRTFAHAWLAGLHMWHGCTVLSDGEAASIFFALALALIGVNQRYLMVARLLSAQVMCVLLVACVSADASLHAPARSRTVFGQPPAYNSIGVSQAGAPGWAGTYVIASQSECDPSSCCCLVPCATFTVTATSSTSAQFTAPVHGTGCDLQTKLSVTLHFASSNPNSGTGTAMGKTYVLSRTGNTVQFQDADAAGCNGKAVCVGGACFSPAAPASTGCGGGGADGAFSWQGQWVVRSHSGCDPTTCCCVSPCDSITISATSTTAATLVGPVEGACGTASRAHIPLEVVNVTGTGTLALTGTWLDGSQLLVSRAPYNNTAALRQIGQPRCSALTECESGTCHTPGSPDTTGCAPRPTPPSHKPSGLAAFFDDQPAAAWTIVGVLCLGGLLVALWGALRYTNLKDRHEMLEMNTSVGKDASLNSDYMALPTHPANGGEVGVGERAGGVSPPPAPTVPILMHKEAGKWVRSPHAFVASPHSLPQPRSQLIAARGVAQRSPSQEQYRSPRTHSVGAGSSYRGSRPLSLPQPRRNRTRGAAAASHGSSGSSRHSRSGGRTAGRSFRVGSVSGSIGGGSAPHTAVPSAIDDDSLGGRTQREASGSAAGLSHQTHDRNQSAEVRSQRGSTDRSQPYGSVGGSRPTIASSRIPSGVALTFCGRCGSPLDAVTMECSVCGGV